MVEFILGNIPEYVREMIGSILDIFGYGMVQYPVRMITIRKRERCEKTQQYTDHDTIFCRKG